MVKKFLKIAGVKTEQEFYNKYPSEGAFFKAHPEAKDFKQYKQGGQMKKLNQLTNWTNDVDNMIPTAQYGCKGKSCTQTGEGIKKHDSRLGLDDTHSGSGGFIDYAAYNAPSTWEELQTYNETNPKDKAFKNQLKTLQGQFPGLTQQQMLAAGADSARIRQRMGNLPRYDKPEEQTYDKAYHQFYRPLMDQSKPVTIPQILQFQSQQPGGLEGYEGTVRSNYGKKKAQNGAPIGSYMSSPSYETKMMNFSEYMNPVDKMITGSTQEERDAAAKKQTEDAAKQKSGGGGGLGNILNMASQFMGKGAGGSDMGAIGASALGGVGKGKNGLKRAQIGLNQPQNGSMPSNNNPYMYNSLQPLGGSQQAVTNPYQNPLMLDPNQTGTFEQQVAGSAGAVNPKKKFNPLGAIPIAGQIFGGIQQIKAAKTAEKEANKQFQLSGLTKQAGLTRGEPIKRKYVRPEDQVINENEMFPTYGVGTNYIAEDGAEVTRGGVGGNPTEIQNMYNPYNLFKDLGYEPLEDSERVKQYQGGGLVSGSQFGQIGNQLGAMVGGGGQGTPGGWSQALGAIPGPIGMIGGMVGSVIDGKQQAKIRNFQERAQKNVVDTAMQQGMQNVQSQYSNVMEDGGYVSHDWQPQVIASFGGHRVSDLLHRDPAMDTLRTGGHITQNNMFPQDQYALGGQVKTTWGGEAKTISQNPYMPGTGETINFYGQSHSDSDGRGNTGIGVKYGDGPHDSYTDYAEYGTEQPNADVEVERGEPSFEMNDPETGEKNLTVLGNLIVNKKIASQTNDDDIIALGNKYHGKKFKNIGLGLSKQEVRHNKTIEKNLKIINNSDDITSYDQLEWLSAKAKIDGAKMELKQIAYEKIVLSSFQNAINEGAEEHGLDADSLAKGKFRIDKKAMDESAKWGKSIKKAQNGTTEGNFVGPTPTDYLDGLYEQSKNETNKNLRKKYTEIFQKEFHRFYPEQAKEIILGSSDVTTKGKKMGIKNVDQLGKKDDKTILNTNVDGIFGDRTEQYHAIAEDFRKPYTPTTIPVPGTSVTKTTTDQTTHYPVTPYKGSKLMDAYSQLIPYLRPSDQEALDPTQMYGEMYALATNQLDPVQAQLYRPLLDQPYDISLQDQLNANQADFNAIQRQTGYNPAAAATLAGQKYAANSKVLADQFRMNQGMKAEVYNKNRGTLNDAQLKNLGILDQQMVRQETAKSRTKEVGQAALNSISDKILKQKLANRTLSIYENMYNYRFDKSGRAVNMNPAFQPNIPNVLPVYDDQGNVVAYQKGTTTTNQTTAIPLPPLALPTGGKNGTKVPSRNRDILRAMKNL